MAAACPPPPTHPPRSAGGTTDAAVGAIVPDALPFDVAEIVLGRLVTGPRPLSADGAVIGHGLPRGLIAINRLRALLLHPCTSYAARDATWRYLIMRARGDGSAWVVAAAGVALPGLRRAAARLGRDHLDPADVQAELLAGFLTAMHRIDLDEARVCPRLCNAAYAAARAALAWREPATCGELDLLTTAAAPTQQFGHPDLVLARAVAAGVITAAEADLIGTTRLEDVTIDEYARRAGWSYQAACKKRQRAEKRLVATLRAARADW